MIAAFQPVRSRAPFVPALTPAARRRVRRKGLGSFVATNPSPYSSITNASLYSVGAASGVYEALSSSAPITTKIGSSLVSVAPFTGPAAPFVAAAGALTSLVGQIGKGCGQACIQSAQAEQVYEAAADNVTHAAQSGFISGTQATGLLDQILAAGQANLSQLAQTDPKAQGGIQNLAKSMSGNFQVASQIGSATKACDPNSALSTFIPTSTKGWYSDSLSAGSNIAQQALSQVGCNPQSSGSAMTLSSLSSSPLILLAVVGGVLYLVMR